MLLHHLPTTSNAYRETPIRTGVKFCCCRVFPCIQFGFLTSKYGMIKIFEILLAIICQAIVFEFGADEARKSSVSSNPYFAFMSATSASFTTTGILLVCYVFSVQTFKLIKASIFELAYNSFTAFLYFMASGTVAIKAQFFANPLRFFTGSEDSKVLTILYYMGGLLTLVYIFDAILAFKNRQNH